MIAADFLRDPTGIRIGHALANGPTAGSCGPFLFGCNSAQAPRHLHGSTKLDSEGRLWMMRCAPSISIVAQSLCMAVILPPENGPQQTGAVQVVQRARWMTSEQGQRIPAEVGGSLPPTAAAMYELVEVIQKDAPPMRRHSGMCR